MTGAENLIHNIATVAFVLGREDLNVRFVRDTYGEFALPTLLDGLLTDLEDAIKEQGRYDIPLLINAENIARLMQLEIGSAVKVVTERTHRGDVQWMEMI